MKDEREKALQIACALREVYDDMPSIDKDICDLSRDIVMYGEITDKERKRLVDIICDVVALSESLCEILKGVDNDSVD